MRPTSPLPRLHLSTTYEARVDQKPPKDGSHVSLEVERQRIVATKDGKRTITIEDAPASVKVVDSWEHKDGGYVVRFVVEALDQPRLLHKQAWKGYTHLPHLSASGEPEAVDSTVLEEYASDNRQRFLAGKADKTLAERVRELEKAHSLGADVGRQLMALRRRVEAAERRLHRDAA